tara:strand:+ start:12054 stop:12914 length:861 start_codon:yes stop_codon:yes gene_type:complete
MIGIGDYANTSRLMNDNVRQFKGLASEVASDNIKIAQQATQSAREMADLDDVRNAAQEFGIKTTKELAAKGLKAAYSAKIPFTGGGSIKDLDQQAAGGLENLFSQGLNIPPPLKQASTTTGFDSMSQIEPGSTPGQPEVSGRLESPDGEVRPTESVEMTSEAGADVESAGSDIVGAGAEAGESAAGAEIGEAVAQTAGVALDSTGILAPLGALVGLGADIFALFEGAKTTADFVGREVLGTTPEPTATGVQIQTPTQPLTMAQKGFGVTPSLDTFDVQHNTISSRW